MILHDFKKELLESSWYDPIDAISFAPKKQGIYACWFVKDAMPNFSGHHDRDGYTLLYIGQGNNLKDRLYTHFSGNNRAQESVLREKIGYLLSEELEICLEYIEDTSKYDGFIKKFKTFGAGEEKLTIWMQKNIKVTFALIEKGDISLKVVEHDIIRCLKPSLNEKGFKDNPSLHLISEAKERMRKSAEERWQNRKNCS